MQEIKDKKIAVIGLGGVGGYIGAQLAASCDHVAAAARGKRYDAIKERGIVLHSDLVGEVTGRPAEVVKSAGELGKQDLNFICVKNYSLEAALDEMKPAVGEKTIIVPVMNGVDAGDRIREKFPDNIVCDSVIYIVSMALPDYSVDQQGNFADLRIGIREKKNGSSEALEEVNAILKAAGIRHMICSDIEPEIWKKYILNCAYNVETAAWDLPIGGLRDDPAKADDYASLAREAYEVARAKGVEIGPDYLDSVLEKFRGYEYNASSSLQRDLRDGKPVEFETFSGYIVREGNRLHVPVPASERYYAMLKEKIGNP